jgi:hypothetical protein
MVLNEYIVRTDGLFGITWDKDTSADLQTLRRSYLDSQLTQIIHGLKALDGENLELDANRESWKMYRVLYEQVQPMLITGQCNENLMKTAAGLYLLCLERVSDSNRILRNETPNLPPPPKLPPKLPPPPRKPPPPKPDYQTTPPDQPRMDFHIPYSPPAPKFIVALPGAPPGAPPPPPPPPPPVQPAQPAVAHKIEAKVPTRGGAKSTESAPLDLHSELKAKLAIIRDGVRGTDSKDSSRVRAPPVRRQEKTPPVKMIGQYAAALKNDRPENVHEKQNWSDSESD